MSFLLRRIVSTVRQPCAISSLTNSFRSLTVNTSTLLQNTKPSITELPKSVSITEETQCTEVFNKINKQIQTGEQGRLFAVVQLCGKQFKITEGDIILVEGYWAPTIGDEIRLEKVLLAGAKDFTLIGRPILESTLVQIKATIIEKTLTHTKTHFKKKRRKQYMRINFQRSPNTMIRINTIKIAPKVDIPSGVLNDKRIY
ncbi:39S ribosomal protein L21, mitochondrial [Teleopsis dalmanni]|uniref:39S ribosomal protein L21, mitochondrial n=1 Tax=Teleopsis dalmanni TaxID=139649 RepID=UPI0018CF09C5|nr:39S ribosomal protein L21, mitochondrial [Teleopsis dalmanni]